MLSAVVEQIRVTSIMQRSENLVRKKHVVLDLSSPRPTSILVVGCEGEPWFVCSEENPKP